MVLTLSPLVQACHQFAHQNSFRVTVTIGPVVSQTLTSDPLCQKRHSLQTNTRASSWGLSIQLQTRERKRVIPGVRFSGRPLQHKHPSVRPCETHDALLLQQGPKLIRCHERFGPSHKHNQTESTQRSSARRIKRPRNTGPLKHKQGPVQTQFGDRSSRNKQGNHWM